MMLSNRDLLATTKINWAILLIVAMLCIGVTSGAKNITSHESSTEMSAKAESSEESTELEMKEEPYTSVWAMMYDLWNWMIGGYSESKNAVGEPRTFGKIRRLQMALIPIVFKFGVISAMVTVLVFLAVKTVFLLKMLLLLNAGAILAKILTYKNEHYQQQPAWGASYNSWNTAPAPVGNSWPGAPPNKEIHLHIHGGNPSHQGWQDKSSDYSSNARYFDAANELNNPGPLPYLRSAYPNHNTYYTNTGR